MKKNKMMRVASALLVAVLMTTSVISGTFAKYVTTDSATDSARVAKWGVTVLASGTLFGEEYNEYATDDTTNKETATSNQISATASTSVSLEENGTGNIVAPGTKNTTGMTLSITGTPEVATKVTVSKAKDADGKDIEVKDIYLAAGTYAVLVEVAKNTVVTKDNYTMYYINVDNTYKQATNQDTFDNIEKFYELHDSVTFNDGNSIGDDTNNDTKYYPVKWTLSNTEVATNATNADEQTFYRVSDLYAAIENAFNTTTNTNTTGVVNANTELTKTYTITWEWAFEDTSTYKNGADTILGNLMADTDNDNYVVVKASDNTTSDNTTYTTLTENTDYCLDVAFNVTITVEQVD